MAVMEDNERASTGPWGGASGAEVEGDSRTLSGAASTLVIDLGDVKEGLEQGGMYVGVALMESNGPS